MKIERPHTLTGPHGSINQGYHKGTNRYYRDALMATLVHLKPKYCLEIGTHTGNTARVFQEYFDKHMPDGRLVTADIKQYNQLGLSNVVQAQVYPHVTNITHWHPVTEQEMLENPFVNNPTLLNKRILLQHLNEVSDYGLEHPAFDFAFVDGDHQEQSVWNDLDIAYSLTRKPHYILLDDTEEFEHDVAKIFHDNLKHLEGVATYEFNDWDVLVGAALLWEKDSEDTSNRGRGLRR